MTTSPTTDIQPGQHWQHVKRGTAYEVLGVAELQNGNVKGLREGARLAVYRGDDGKLWAREEGEFTDGRFRLTFTTPTLGDSLATSVAETMEEDGGCWSACSGCQESEDGYVSTKYYPYSPIFKCQPGGGCRECGGIGVIWQDGAFLESYGAALSPALDNTAVEGQSDITVERVWTGLRRFVMPNGRPLAQHFSKSEDQIAFCHAVIAALTVQTEKA